MVSKDIEQQISNNLLSALTSKDKEIGRFIFIDKLASESDLHFWAVRHNTRQITEKQLEIDEFPDIRVYLTLVPPKFFSDLFNDIADVPFWQISYAKRVLTSCKVIFDPEKFLSYYIEKIDNITWSSETIKLKEDVSRLLLKKSQKFVEEDPPMIADAYIWSIKAVEEAICAQLMRKNHFNIATPSLLLDTLNHEPDLKRFYLDLLGVDNLSPDLAVIAIKEFEKLADHLFHASKGTQREMWILTSFVSINEAERKINRVIAKAGEENLDLLLFQSLFEDAIAELWQAFFLAAQTPWRRAVPLDPWVVGLFWKWHVNEKPKFEINQIIERCELILKEGSPYYDWE
ncbi:MAG: hypothetical protein ACXAC7_13215 [Candidatus Hodarchaeales archaeon]|jgi:hypothetical protein